MVLCEIHKYYNQVKFQVLWPRLKGWDLSCLQLEFDNFKSLRQKSPENEFKGFYFKIGTYLGVAQRVFLPTCQALLDTYS